MALPIRIRFAATWATALFAAACGTSGTRSTFDGEPAAVAMQPAAAPRTIELPAGLHTLLAREDSVPGSNSAVSVAAQYEPVSNSPAGPRITNIKAVPKADANTTICQPAEVQPKTAEVKSEPAARLAESPPRRSQFLPVSEPAAAPAVSQPPPLVQAAPAAPAVQPPPTERPMLPPVTAPAASAPVSMPAPQQRDVQNTPTMPRPGQFQPSPVAGNGPPPNAAAMQAVSQRAMQMAEQASQMAQRGMFYSARAELIKAVQLLAQAADVQERGSRRSAALAAGLVALEEAREFTAEAGRPGEAINVPAIAARHRTNMLRPLPDASISPIVAQQQYFAFAQEQLAIAAAGNGAASQILCCLGRLQSALAMHDADPLALHGPKAMVFHQAALATDPSNYLAANELGVLLARYGQLADARRLLVQSVSTRSHAVGWQNLATVHRRLGENDLAQRAEHERQLVEKQQPKSPAADSEMVRWVDAKTFAANPGGDIHWPEPVASKPTTTSVSQTRR